MTANVPVSRCMMCLLRNGTNADKKGIDGFRYGFMHRHSASRLNTTAYASCNTINVKYELQPRTYNMLQYYDLTNILGVFEYLNKLYIEVRKTFLYYWNVESKAIWGFRGSYNFFKSSFHNKSLTLFQSFDFEKKNLNSSDWKWNWMLFFFK